MASETSPVPTWDAFVKSNLLSAGIVSGVCLSAQHGVPIYTHGDLDALEQADLQQFLPVFRSPSSQHTEGILEAGFTISTRGGKTMEFKVYQKTYCRSSLFLQQCLCHLTGEYRGPDHQQPSSRRSAVYVQTPCPAWDCHQTCRTVL
ncbi:uncharacterized protein LOC124140665 isoform X1 [Haliotis rufescens]|uniref:uncharacterized protein LOC124140665 isoform X1 n=1 Tax=Haliotis rufescens TaxID=6454 RepID=UPI00201EBBBD|nr:uncharacterized protein LOC124140665 isoform X1 [Haliotis rufescens]